MNIVEKIEAFDINNITPENIEFMVNTIQDYFLDHFPVKPEIIKSIPDNLLILSQAEYVNIQRGREYGNKGYVNVDFINTPSFYSKEDKKIYINLDHAKSLGLLFLSIFHECLHYSGDLAGASFNGNFLHPILGNDPSFIPDEIYAGQRVLEEGTVQYISLASVIDDIGFKPEDGMFGYEAERIIMTDIWAPFPYEDLLHLYFESSLDNLRLHIEQTFEPEETRNKITHTQGNGVFMDCLADLARAAQYMRDALDVLAKTGDRTDADTVMRDVHHAIGRYIVQKHKNNGTKITDKEKDYITRLD